MSNNTNNKTRCQHCYDGRIEAECCNGYRCSCGGQPVDLGICTACDGTGIQVRESENLNVVMSAVSSEGFIGARI